MPRIRVETPEKFVFATEIPVMISDINYGGHLGHDRVLPLTHEARVRFLEKLNYTEMDFGGYGIILSGVAIEYINESFYGDKIVIKIGLSGLNKNGLDLVYELVERRKDLPIAKVQTSIVFFDYKKRRVERVPEEVIKKLNELPGI